MNWKEIKTHPGLLFQTEDLIINSQNKSNYYNSTLIIQMFLSSRMFSFLFIIHYLLPWLIFSFILRKVKVNNNGSFDVEVDNKIYVVEGVLNEDYKLTATINGRRSDSTVIQVDNQIYVFNRLELFW